MPGRLVNESKSVSTNDAVPITLVLDVDGTLVCHKNDHFISDSARSQWADKNCITAIHHYVINPGTIAFLRYLFNIPNCQIAFFSNNKKERNKLLIKELLLLALGVEKYASIEKDTLKYIFSEDSIVLASREWKQKEFNGYKKKDLTIIPNFNSKTTVLIDDSFSFCIPGQETNILKIKCIDGLAYWDADRFHHLYEVNNIFYVAGVLKAAIQKDRDNLTAHLAKMQFTETTSGDYRPLKTLGTQPEYFMAGFAELKKYMPDLDFYGSDADIKTHFPEYYYQVKAPKLIKLSSTPICLFHRGYLADVADPDKDELGFSQPCVIL